MVAYNFKRMFVPKILAGEKNHTIRMPRRRHARAGELVQMYTGPRFKPERIGVSTCIFAEPISLGFRSGNPFVVIPKRYDLHKRLRALISLPLDDFAKADGFEDWDGMCRFWWDVHKATHFAGAIVGWQPLCEGRP